MKRAIVFALCVLLCAEMALRLVSPPRGQSALYVPDARLFWRMRPNVKRQVQVSPEPGGEQLTTEITTNSLGLRDEEIPPRQPQEYRVLVLGDSSIFGHGLPLQQSFVKQLQEKLQSRWPRRLVRVINGGVSGYSSFQGRIWFDEIAPRVQPDLVIIGYYFSDFITDVMADKNRVPPGFFRLRMMQALAQSRLYQFLRDEMEQSADAAGSGTPRVSVDDYRGNLTAMLDQASSARIQAMLLLLWPRDPTAEQRAWREAARALAAMRKIPLVDMEAAFSGYPQKAALYLDGVHPSAMGDTVIADELCRSLLANSREE